MNKNEASPGADLTKRMFIVSGAAGLVLGVAALLAMFYPYGSASSFGGGVALALSNVSIEIILIAALSGLAMGVLCSSAMYVAMGIYEVKAPKDSLAGRSSVAGLGAAIAAVIPAVLIVPLGNGTGEHLGFVLAALGLIALCFAVGFAIVAVLNRRGVRALNF